MPALVRNPAAWVFLILGLSSAYFWHGRDWNTASRLMLTYALVDRGTVSIDGLQTQTGDLARRDGHYYTEKTPGFSLLGVVPYRAAKAAGRLPGHPLNKPGFAYWPADYWVTLGTSGLLSAWAGAILASLALDLGCGPRRAALVGLAYGLATPAWAYATLAYGHQPAAFCLLAAFALLWRDGRAKTPRGLMARSFAAGVLASYAAVIEIQVGPVAAILAGYALARAAGGPGRRPWGTAVAFGLGALGPAGVLLLYNQVAFGSPWKMGYFFLILDRFREVHSEANPLGLNRPDATKVAALLWGAERGLIRYAPILVLTAPGLAVLVLRRLWGMAAVCSLVMAAVFLVNLSYPEWTGGWTTGPRLLVPLLPFALLPVAALLAWGGRGMAWAAAGLAAAGYAVILLFVGIGGRVPDPIRRPLTDAVWPIWRGDTPLPSWCYGRRFAVTWAELAAPGFVAGLPPAAAWLTVVPLIVLQAALIWAMLGAIRPRPVSPPRGPGPGPTP